mgnify:CR=1 FL=1
MLWADKLLHFTIVIRNHSLMAELLATNINLEIPRITT